MNLIGRRNCPLCGSDVELSTPEVSASIPAESLTESELIEFFIGFRKEQCFFTYFRCSICGILWCPEYFTADGLEHLYSSMPENNAVSGEKDTARTQDEYARRMISRKLVGRSLMDIGADTGLLSKALLESGQVDRIIAIEPNKAVHLELASNIGPQGLVVESVSDLEPSISVQAAAAIHVLDHLLEPIDYVRSVTKHMNGTSHFYAVVHNERSLLRVLLGRRWAPFCLQHPQLFNPSTLANILARVGFERSEVTRTRNWMSLKQAATLMSSISIAPQSLSQWVPGWSIPTKLGNIDISASRQEYSNVEY